MTVAAIHGQWQTLVFRRSGSHRIAARRSGLPGQGRQRQIELTYTFLTSASSSTLNKHGITGFSEFNAQQKGQTVLALQSWADVANVTFTEKATAATVT